MNKISTLLAVLLATSALSSITFAVTQDQSFTFTSTAGMFEDMYDYFKSSPAYLPGFKKNVLWGQFSNLENGGDTGITNTYHPGFISNFDDTYYLIGGQMDLAGLGRMGLMLDWNGYGISPAVTNYNGSTGFGFCDSNVVAYHKTDPLGELDLKTETYSRVKRVLNINTNDLYLPYGLGGIMGADLGVAVRGTWYTDSPTYDNWASTAYGEVGYTLDEATRSVLSNMLNGQAISTFDRTASGKFEYGNYNWKLILAGRVKELAPHLDLNVNLGPILNINVNQLKAEIRSFTNNNPAVVNTQESIRSLEGAEIEATNLVPYGAFGAGDYSFMPGTGIGALASARADYEMSSTLRLIGQVEYITQPIAVKDAKLDSRTIDDVKLPNGTLTQETYSNYLYRITYDGMLNLGSLKGKLRLQYLAKGWKLGLGVHYTNAWNSRDLTKKTLVDSLARYSGTGSSYTDRIETITGAYEFKEITETLTSQFDFPMGVEFNLIENLPFHLGLMHSFKVNVTNISSKMTSRSPQITYIQREDGSTSSSVMAFSNSTEESSSSAYDVNHSNYFFYGASWLVFPDVQIDFTGFNGALLTLSNYRLSMSFYF